MNRRKSLNNITMKRKFKNVLVTMLAVFVTIYTVNISQAQQGRQQGPPPIPDDAQIEKMVEDLSESLSLTDDQEKQVSEKYFAHFDEVKVKMEAGRPSRDDMESLKTDFEKDLKSVLTKDQQDLYTAYLKKQEKNRPQRQR